MKNQSSSILERRRSSEESNPNNSNYFFEKAASKVSALLFNNNDKLSLEQFGKTLEEQWNYVLDNWKTYGKSPKSCDILSDLLTRGVPPQFRPFVWQYCSGAHNSNLINSYKTLLEHDSPCERQIKRDVHRTFPNHEMFKVLDGPGQNSLFNVIKAYSIYDKEVGYCQGSAFIVGILLIHMPEEEAFACFVQFMCRYELRELYKPDMAMLGVRMFQLDGLVEEVMPELSAHFIQFQFPSSLYASPWFLTMFSISINIEFSVRVIDLFLCEGILIIFKVALAILKYNEKKLLTMDMEAMLMCLQHNLSQSLVDKDSQAQIFELAQTFEISKRKLKRMEKEYQNKINQEREEQSQLRRIRNELELLRKRCQNLEEDNKLITEQLVTTQISRANDCGIILELRNQLSKTNSELSWYRETTINSADDDFCSKIHEDQSSVYNIPQLPYFDEFAANSSPKSPKELCQIVGNNLVSNENNMQINGSFTEDLKINNQDKSKSPICKKDLIDPSVRVSNYSHDLLVANSKIKILEEQIQDLYVDRDQRISNYEADIIRLKKREAQTIIRADDCERRMSELEKLWFSASSLSKSTTNNNSINVQTILLKMSDRIAEAKLIAKIQDLEADSIDMQTRHELNQSQLHRLSDRLMKLEERLGHSEFLKSQLRCDLKCSENKIADVEAKKNYQELFDNFSLKTDEMIWRIREMELLAQLTEERQRSANLECTIEEMQASLQLQMRQSFLSNYRHNSNSLENLINENPMTFSSCRSGWDTMQATGENTPENFNVSIKQNPLPNESNLQQDTIITNPEVCEQHIDVKNLSFIPKVSECNALVIDSN